ncbi:MAG TPA: hypothetical protein PL157_04120, partial [Acidobacteriota bacterium]|nr:hypothetical protein [Acidobacteriota bacterium]
TRFFSSELASLQPVFFSPELASLQPEVFSPNQRKTARNCVREIAITGGFRKLTARAQTSDFTGAC